MTSLRRLFLWAAMASCCSSPLSAQTLYDVTGAYLTNAGFDTDFDYTVDDTGNVAQEILDVKGWTKNISVNYTITGVYQLGTKKTFNGASVPTLGYDGTAQGGVLALSTGWNQSLLFYQNVTLPPGNYALVSAWYNSADKSDGYSRVGWRPTGRAAKVSAMKTFPIGQWVADTVRFEVTEAQKGIIQVGFQASADKGSANFAKPVLDFVRLFRDTPLGKADVDVYKTRLQTLIDEAVTLLGAGTGNGADMLQQAIAAAQTVMADDEATIQQVDEAMAALSQAIDDYQWANPTGAVPTVVTDKRFARGATMAFGRMTVAGVPAAQLAEQGFCWSEDPQPTIHDQKTTRYISNNGNIYWLENLKPGTRYYMRAYAVTNGRQVAYGDVVRFHTIPKGQISFSMRESSDAAADQRIRAAAQTAIDWWNNLTEMKGYAPNIGHNPGTPTAECSYGGWMSVGANQAYQKPGTIMHEMLHGCGVIPWAGTEWAKFDLRSGTSNAAGFTTGSGLWLGDRVTEVLRFWDNSATAQLNGDYQHMWPYGINGASEDNGSDVLYIGNGLVCQALGEDGLQHTSQLFAEPYDAFNYEEGVKYYLRSEDADRGLYSAFLVPTARGTLQWRHISDDEAAANDSTAWYVTFTPANQYYQLRNVATGQYLSYATGGFRMAERTAVTAMENLHLMKGRKAVGTTGQRGYWLIHPTNNWTPPCLQADANGAVESATFDISNNATSQRWLILTMDELSGMSQSMLAEMKARGELLLSRLQALVDVPHSEDVEGADNAIVTVIQSLQVALTQASSTAEVQPILTEAEEAAFLFLCRVTPTDMAQPFDLTYLLKNPGMDATEGWSESPTLNYSCGEFYEKSFDFNQTVAQLPAGTYQLRCKGFQRPGRAAECSGATVTSLIYAGGKSKRMAHVMDDAQTARQGGSESSVGGLYIPNDMQAASIYFSKGLYENRVTSTVATDGGSLKVGMRSATMNSYYWVIFDDFRLCFFGKLSPEEVEGIGETSIPTLRSARPGVYALDGRFLFRDAADARRLPRGLYVVDGRLVICGE